MQDFWHRFSLIASNGKFGGNAFSRNTCRIKFCNVRNVNRLVHDSSESSIQLLIDSIVCDIV